MQPYLSGQFGFIDNPYRQFGNGSVWTRTRTLSDSPEPLLTLTVDMSGMDKYVSDNYTKEIAHYSDMAEVISHP